MVKLSLIITLRCMWSRFSHTAPGEHLPRIHHKNNDCGIENKGMGTNNLPVPSCNLEDLGFFVGDGYILSIVVAPPLIPSAHDIYSVENTHRAEIISLLAPSWYASYISSSNMSLSFRFRFKELYLSFLFRSIVCTTCPGWNNLLVR